MMACKKVRLQTQNIIYIWYKAFGYNHWFF